jgi:hypothetical protein
MQDHFLLQHLLETHATSNETITWRFYDKHTPSTDQVNNVSNYIIHVQGLDEGQRSPARLSSDKRGLLSEHHLRCQVGRPKPSPMQIEKAEAEQQDGDGRHRDGGLHTVKHISTRGCNLHFRISRAMSGFHVVLALIKPIKSGQTQWWTSSSHLSVLLQQPDVL